MQIQIKARQTVILDGTYKGFNPGKPYVVIITATKQVKSLAFDNKVKYLEYKKKTPKLRKARLNVAGVKVAKLASGKIEYIGYRIPENKFRIKELLIGLMIDGKPHFFK
jgi:hypothetical protein